MTQHAGKYQSKCHGTPMSAMEGRLFFRLNLNDSSSEIATSKAKKRKLDNLQLIPGESSGNAPLSGYFFVPSDLSQSNFAEYLVSVPFTLLKKLCEAVVYNLKVVISKYSIAPLPTTALDCQPSAALLEVFSEGFSLLEEHPAPSMADVVLTLRELALKEMVERDGKLKSGSKEKYDIEAVVEAVSPIVAMDPTDPFALVEVHDPTLRHISCVLVMRGNHALQWHSALQPGETWQFRRLAMQSWRVPKVLMCKAVFLHLKHRIPPRVYIFSKETTLQFVKYPSGNSEPSTNSLTPSLPATTDPLVSLQGKIHHVDTKEVVRSGKKYHMCASIALVPINVVEVKNQNVCRLIVTNYPLATGIQLGIVKGAILRAVNVHALGQFNGSEQVFGACLRSTISLVCSSTEASSNGKGFSSLDLQESINSHSLERGSNVRAFKTPIRPFFIGNWKYSYHESNFKKNTKNWLHRCFPVTDSDPTSVAPLPSVATVVETVEGFTATQRTKTSARNPYAEFFDHGHEEGRFEDKSREDVAGCNFSRDEESCRETHSCMGMNEIRLACLQVLIQRLRTLIKTSMVSKYWTGSIHLTPEQLQKEQSEGTPSSVCIGGYVGALNLNNEPVSLSDRICQLVVRFVAPSSAAMGDFIVGKLHSAIVSCYFLSVPSETERSPESVVNTQTLPLTLPLFRSTVGGMTLIRLDDYLIVAAVQLRCTKQYVISHHKNRLDSPGRNRNSNVTADSLDECLKNPAHWNTQKGAMGALLIRSRLRYAKVNTLGYAKSLLLTLTGIDSETNQGIEQSVKLTVGILRDSATLLAFKRATHEIVPEGMQVLEEEYVLGAMWWQIAANCRTSPLVNCGWDEYQNGSNASSVAVRLQVPCDKMSFNSRGYFRWECMLEALDVAFFEVCTSDKEHASDKSVIFQPSFDFIGTGKYYDGMLSRRPPRRSTPGGASGRTLGARWPSASFSGPEVTIADLFRLACESIGEQQPSILSPSLIRRLPGANFLGVVFCEVRCVCGACFEHLTRTKAFHDNVDDAEFHDEPSFWHNTNGDMESASRSKSRDKVQIPAFIMNAGLRCPNDCPIAMYQVHWECSGILDDGTGQAKLFAERDAALTLLDMPREMVDDIEKGIWSTADGILRFNKVLPPSSRLKEQIKWAQSRGYNGHQNPLMLLSAGTRAEYLLQHHCRSRLRQSLKLDYFVRCKPLAEGICHLNHTVVDAYSTRTTARNAIRCDVSSYSLPPLKLELLDCSIRP